MKRIISILSIVKGFNIISFCLILGITLVNCVGTVSTTKYPVYKNTKFKNAYVVSAENSKYIRFKFGYLTPGLLYIPPTEDNPAIKTEAIGNTDIVIKSELEKYGIITKIGQIGDTLENIDVIVKYNDTWRWDGKKVLDELAIYFITPDSNKVIAKSLFKIGNTEFHNYPSAEKEVPKMIKELMDN